MENKFLNFNKKYVNIWAAGVVILIDKEIPILSVLFITYKRQNLLEKSFFALRPLLNHLHVEYVVSDDGSPADVQERIATMPFDRFLLPKRNRGLGANNNQGLAACRASYILMVQDDWEATEQFCGIIDKALEVLDADQQVGMIRFVAGDPTVFPLEERRIGNLTYFVCDHGHPEYDHDARKHVYSDTPHIRRDALADPSVLGPYKENCPMEISEEEYANRFEAQNRYRIAFMSNTENTYFINLGINFSHRTGKFRYKLDASVRAVAIAIGFRPEGKVWQRTKYIWFGFRDLLIRIKILK